MITTQNKINFIFNEGNLLVLLSIHTSIRIPVKSFAN